MSDGVRTGEMLWQISLYVLVVLFSAQVTAGLAVYAWRQRSAPGVRSFSALMLTATLWSVTVLLEMTGSTTEVAIFWVAVRMLSASSMPVLWLLFVLRYTGRGQWMRVWRAALLAVIPLLTQLFVWTNPSHGLMASEFSFSQAGAFLLAEHFAYGPWFWVHLAYSYLLYVLGIVLLADTVLRSHNLYRGQAMVLLLGALLAGVVTAVEAFRVFPELKLALVPLAFPIAGIGFAWGLLRYQLFDLVPVAREVLVERMGDVMVVVDGRDRVVDLNAAAEQLSGSLRREAIGRPISSLLGPQAGLDDYVHGAAGAHNDLAVERDGRTRFFEVQVVPLEDPHRGLLGRLVTLRDVTGRREVESVLQRRTQELQARNEELDAFAHTVAHDLKGSLTRLIGYADLLLDNCDIPDEGRGFVQEIANGSQKMQNIVDELLLLAQVREGEVRLTPLDMTGIVAEALGRLSYLIELRQAEIAQPAGWPAALGYAPWVEEIWVNYLSNAILHGGRPPRVELGGERQADGRVRFWVRDNGTGVSAEVRSQLFLPFTQWRQARAHGHGLGLSIVHRIMEKLGGEVGLEDKPGNGAEFYFVLPGVEVSQAS